MKTLDPLKQETAGPPQGRVLFEKFSQVARGFPHDAAVDAALNVLLTAIRQACPTRAKAEKMFDEAAGKSKHLLLEQHYNADGSRRNIFPFTQHVRLEEPHVEKNKFLR